jgi:GNAT superfamily N-acetyltransferase
MSTRERFLEPADVPQALALSQAAGWSQTPADWLLAIKMNPSGCFAIECDDAVIATTTTIRYGTDLAWIGMVLTHPEFRNRGYARTLMQKALDHLSDIATVKLDATEMGKPLYEKLGFEAERTVERWRRPPQSSPSPNVDPFASNPQLDKTAFGTDRAELLQELAKIEAASISDEAFAMYRPSRFGPCVSPSKEAAQKLAQHFVACHPNETILWDLFPENNQAEPLGFEFARRVTRMTKGRCLQSDSSLIYACAGFEFG